MSTFPIRFVVVIKGDTWLKGQKRYTIRPVDFYVSGISWDGDKIKKTSSTKDIKQAVTMAKFMAERAVSVLTGWGYTASMQEAKVNG